MNTCELRAFVGQHHPDPQKRNTTQYDDKKFKEKRNQYIAGLCDLKVVRWSLVWEKLPANTVCAGEEIFGLYERGFIDNTIFCDKAAKKPPTFWTKEILDKISATDGERNQVRDIIKQHEQSEYS